MAGRTFTLFHFNLVPITQMDIQTTDMPRVEWLRTALAETFEFEHWGGGTLHWVPVGEMDECLVGLLERTRQHDHHKPPSEGGGEIISDEWQAAYVIIDPTHHDEGQRAAVENDIVGQPRALLKSLVEAVNSRPQKPYQIEVEPLYDANRFWNFSSKHGDVLKKIKFEFVVPNMWGTESDLEKDLKDTGQQTGAERVGVELKGEDGVATKNQRIQDGVSYTEKGAGTLSATAPDGSRFSSTSRPKTSRIPLIQGGTDAVISAFQKLKGQILGREQNNTLDDTNRDGNNSVDD